MRLGLIKKSLICVLSVSFCAILASCTKNGAKQSVSKKNVFAQKDILAYAKKNKYVAREEYTPSIVDFSEKDYFFIETLASATLLLEKSSAKTKLFTRKANQIFEINDGTLNPSDMSNVYVNSSDIDYYLYSIKFGSEYSLVDNYGNIIVKEKEYSSLNINRILDSKAIVDGDNTFYEIISYNLDGNTVKEVYKVEAKFKDKKVISSPVRTKIESADEIDYSAMNYSNAGETITLKDYDVVMSNGSAYVTNTSGKVVSSFTMMQYDSGIVLDDKMIIQSVTDVTRNDNYTYCDDDDFYLLQTYSIDLKTGVITEIKNYKYLISDDVDFIYGYNEKTDRTYVAAEYAKLYEVSNKRLSTTPICGMIDKDGKMISTKIGEVGNEFYYLDDNAYVLYDGKTCSILDSKGKLKGSFVDNGNNFNIDFNNKFIFIRRSGTSGLILDSDLKVIDYPGRDNIICYGIFDNGNALVYMNGVNALVKFNGNKMEIIKSYDGTMTAISKPYGTNNSNGYTCVAISDELVNRNLYIVHTKVDDDKWNTALVDANGETLKEYNDVIYVYSSYEGGTFIELRTSETTYYISSTVFE